MPRAGHVRHQHHLQRIAASASSDAGTEDRAAPDSPPFGYGASRFDVRGNVHPQNRTPGSYTEAVYEPSRPHKTGWDDGPGQYASHQKLHPRPEPLLQAFREVGAQSKPDREKYVLKPSLLKEHRKTAQQEATLRGPGYYQYEDCGPTADVAQVLKQRLESLHGISSPLAIVRSASAPCAGSPKAFPQPVSLKKLGLSQKDAEVLRAAAFKKKCGWALESKNRNMYRVRGARHSFIGAGEAPDVPHRYGDQSGSVEQPTRGGQGPALAIIHPTKSFVEQVLQNFNTKHTTFENTLGGRDTSSTFARVKGQLCIGDAATAQDPNIGPGYITPIDFTAEPAIRKMKQLKCNSMEEVEGKESLLRTRMKMSQEKVANHRRKQAEDQQWKQETHERRKRTKWAESQRKLRAERATAGKTAISAYDSSQRIPALKSPAKESSDVQSRAFQANTKAVAKTDDNFVRLLNEREPSRGRN